MAENAHPLSRLRRRWYWVLAAGVVIAGLVIAGQMLLGPKESVPEAEVVTLFGVDYTTNVPIDEHNGYVYVYLHVNEEVENVVLEVEHPGDTAEIRDFLDTLDTFVPGEHVIALSHSNLHVIVDGMADE